MKKHVEWKTATGKNEFAVFAFRFFAFAFGDFNSCWRPLKDGDAAETSKTRQDKTGGLGRIQGRTGNWTNSAGSFTDKTNTA